MTTPSLLHGETLLLSVTRHLIGLGTVNALCEDGLTFLARALGADLGMLHLAREGDTFQLAAHVGEHPLLHVHETQQLAPRWRDFLLAGNWYSRPLVPGVWDGPPEKDYLRLGARHLVCLGLHSGQRLVGYVGLLFDSPRPDLDDLTVLGTVGALWGTLLERLGAQAALRGREAMLRSVTDNGTDLVTVLDGRGRVTYQSAGAMRMVGHGAHEMLHRDIFGYIHPEDARDVMATFAALAAAPDSTARATYRFAHADGRFIWVESHARNLLHDPDVEGVVVHSRDVSEWQATQRVLERRVRDLTAMHETSQALMGADSVDAVATTVVGLIRTRLRHEFVRLLRRLPDGTVVSVAHAADGSPGPEPLLRPVVLRPGEGLVGACVTSGRSVVVGDVRTDGRYLAVHEDVRSELVVPLWVNGQVWGALNVESTTPDAFSDEDRRALETIAAQTGASLSSVVLVEDLRAAYDETISGWARALDMRDRETEGHSQRVTQLTVTLARRMGVTEEDLVHVRRGALLHDIGKMGIPDGVLLKPGPLDEEQWAIMRRHPDLALDLLSPIAFLSPALDIPAAHHEKWDGSGYPRGLKGEDIPLAARIFAVVDVWDALRNDRPYRPAWPPEKARAHITAEAGRHFDPDVVRAFLGLLDESASA